MVQICSALRYRHNFFRSSSRWVGGGGAIGESPPPRPRPRDRDFFAAPRRRQLVGEIGGSSKSNGPFATIARARDAVRALLESQTQRDGVRVILRAGTYYLDSPLEFGPEDSGTEKAPVVYAAAAGEKVVLSGGRRLWADVGAKSTVTGLGCFWCRK